MINNHDDLIKHMESASLCIEYVSEKPRKALKSHLDQVKEIKPLQYYLTDGTQVDQALVASMIKKGFLTYREGLVPGSHGQELEYAGGLL